MRVNIEPQLNKGNVLNFMIMKLVIDLDKKSAIYKKHEKKHILCSISK